MIGGWIPEDCMKVLVRLKNMQCRRTFVGSKQSSWKTSNWKDRCFFVLCSIGEWHGMTLHDVRICSDDQAMHVTCDEHEHGSSYGSFRV